MAEYIEREALLSELKEEIDFETSMYTEEQNKYFNMGLKCAVRDVKSQPTADVAPKSEVDEIVRQWKEEANCWQNNYITELRANEQIKAEVAREIFEDFIKHKVCTNEEDFRVLAQLKKKYTEV